MIQAGIILLALATHSIYLGKIAAGLVGIFAGLYLISVRRVSLRTRIKFREMFTPVEDSEDAGFFEQYCRALSYLAGLGAAAVLVVDHVVG